MEISIGTGLTIFSCCATFIGVFYRVVPSKKNGNGFNQAVCEAKHKAIDEKHAGFEKWLERIEGKLDKAISQ